MTDRPEGRELVSVPEVARQTEEIRARWSWVEPTVWTERMLTALENGVKGGVWYSLIDKVYAKVNLEAAFRRVETNRGSPGVDHVTIRQFAKRSESEIMTREPEGRELPAAGDPAGLHTQAGKCGEAPARYPDGT